MNDKTTPAATSEEQALEAISDSKLDTVRDILFGAQVKQTNQKNEQLEQLIQATADELQKNFDQKIQALTDSITTLKTTLAEQAKKTSADIAKQFSDTQADIDALDASTKTQQSDMFDELTAEREALETRASAWNEDLAKQLETIHHELLHSKTDRSSLANMLTTMAASLSPETHGDNAE